MTASLLNTPSLAILIPTYGRDHVLIDTIAALLALPPPAANEIIVLDQTARHAEDCEAQLLEWHRSQIIRWVRIPYPSITSAMNLGLIMASSDHVLFVDDDIIPDSDLLAAHRRAAHRYPKSLIAGRVLQPWHQGKLDPDDAPFRFNSLIERDHHEFIGCNVSMDRKTALEIGGFDRNFVRVAYRYEAEFSYRWRRAGYRLRYEPTALVHHLKIRMGGTRAYSEHLTTIRPDHAVGRYYYYWRTHGLLQALFCSVSDFFKSVYTRHHLSKPWWIPLTLLAELRGFLWSCRLALAGPSLQPTPPARLLIITSHPIQYQVPLFRLLSSDPKLDVEVLFLTLPDPAHQGEGFGVPFTWDTPLLTGYKWRRAKSIAGSGGLSSFKDLRLRHPLAEINSTSSQRPDVILMTGWQCLGLMQLMIAAYIKRIPVLLRMENNDKKQRGFLSNLLHRLVVGGTRFVLPVGKANARYYQNLGVTSSRMINSPYCVDNDHFALLADRARPLRQELRHRWGVPDDAFCFLFCGKFQEKKHPKDILDALELLQSRHNCSSIHCVFVGSGEQNELLQDQAERSNLPVTFAGFLNQGELSSAYVVADALVLASDCDETWGLVVNEAMACGLPAIVSDQVGCSEDLVKPGLTGLIYPSRDVDSLANAMLALASDPQASQQMGRNAIRLITSEYSPFCAAQAIEQASLFTFCCAFR